jgi:hypothetical protein
LQTFRRSDSYATFAAIIMVPAGLYIASGILRGFLEADDFGWLTTARDQTWHHIFSYRVATAVVSVIAIVTIGRFSIFTSRAIASHNESFTVYRDYAQLVTDCRLYKPGATEILVPAPNDAHYDRASIQPMLRWVLKQPDLIVRVDEARAPCRH